jgi:hypothetical protein
LDAQERAEVVDAPDVLESRGDNALVGGVGRDRIRAIDL